MRASTIVILVTLGVALVIGSLGQATAFRRNCRARQAHCKSYPRRN